MSNYNKEQGSIQFTKSGFAKVRTAYRRIHNDAVNELYQHAVAAYKHVKAIPAKNLPKDDYSKNNCATTKRRRAAMKYLENLTKRSVYSGVFGREAFQANILGRTELSYIDACWFYPTGKLANTFMMPKKKDFPTLTNKQASFDVETKDCCELNLSFHDETHSISWAIDENNRAVESCHSFLLFKKLFSFLNNDYKWGREEGGTAYEEGEYGNETHYFGTSGKKQQERDHNAMLVSAGVYDVKPKRTRKRA